MNDISLLINDKKLNRLIELELTACGYSVSTEPSPCTLMIYDADACVPDKPKAKRLAAVSALHEKYEAPADVTVIERPFALTAFRETVALLLRPEAPRERNRAKTRFTLDSDTRSVNINGNTLRLSGNEFTILSALAAKRGETVSRDELRGLIGNENGNMTDVYICRLRRKLETRGIRCIGAVRGVGYVLL